MPIGEVPIVDYLHEITRCREKWQKAGQEAWQLGAKRGGNFLGKYGAEAFTEEEINAIVNQMDDLVVTAKRVVPIKQYVQFTSKLGRSKVGQRVFSYQARFSKSNLNILDRGFRAAFKNTTSNYLGKPYKVLIHILTSRSQEYSIIIFL